jgi:hypothetical protein
MQKRIIAAAISSAALVVAVLHVRRPDLPIDAITIGLGVIALVPWLDTILKSVKLPGGWEIVYRDLVNQVNDARQEAKEAKGSAEDVGVIAQTALEKATASVAREGPGRSRQVIEVDLLTPSAKAQARLAELEEQYDKLRDTPSGDARTAAMTAVVGSMISLASEVQHFDVEGALAAEREKRGRRLAAYAYLYTRPDFSLLDKLVHSVTVIEDKPFGQYWGIKAIGRVLSGHKVKEIDPRLVEALDVFLLKHLKMGTDRHHALSKILRDLREGGRR